MNALWKICNYDVYVRTYARIRNCSYVRTYVQYIHQQTIRTYVCTVEPPNKGHFEGQQNPATYIRNLFFVERFSPLGGSKCTYDRNETRTTSRVLCREVYYTVSIFGRVHYQRFHCTYGHLWINSGR